jgi:hypothetical protein
MKKLNDSFENKWKSQFQDAEATPSVSAWDRIDANLAGSELARYKKKLFYYKITAAAAIFLAVLFGSYSVYNLIQDSNSNQLVQGLQTDGDEVNADKLTSSDPNQNSQSIRENQFLNTREDQITSILNDEVTDEYNNQIVDKQDDRSGILLKQNMIPASYKTSSSEFTSKTSQKSTLGYGESTDYDVEKDQILDYYSPVAVFHIPYEKPGRKYYLHKKVNPYDMPYILPVEEEFNENDPKRLWAGIVLSSGVFNPNISYNEINDIAADASPTFGSVERINMAGTDFDDQSNSIMSYKPEESSYNSEASFSYGIDFGYKFSKKFVVFSGLGYQHNHGSTTVHTYIEPTETRAKYANHAIVIERASPESGLDTYNELNSGVELNSVFEFVTVPVNFGYYLIDKRFKWIMTAGVTTDVFIKNSINDSQSLFNEVQYKNGEDSPYNPIYFNGKFGTMINYTFLKNYQLSLEPSYRIGLSDLTKDNATFSSRPSSFLISAGIAYVFR